MVSEGFNRKEIKLARKRVFLSAGASLTVVGAVDADAEDGAGCERCAEVEAAQVAPVADFVGELGVGEGWVGVREVAE